MKNTGVQIIEQRRKDYVNREAKELFDGIIEQACQMTPADKYIFEVTWKERPPVLDKMILDRTSDLFKEMGSDMRVTDRGPSTVNLELTPEGSAEEQVIVAYHWSRKPGNFVNKKTGQPVALAFPGMTGPAFTGTVREWYETLMETMIDCGNQLHRELQDVPTTAYVGENVLCILESSVLFKPNFKNPSDNKVGTLANRFNVYVDASLTDTIRMVVVKDGKRFVGTVKVTDLNII